MKKMMVLCCLCLIVSSCATKQPSAEDASTVKLRVEGKTDAVDSKSYAQNGKIWVPVERAAESVHYRYVWKPERQTALVGYTDPIYELTAKVKKAKAGDQEIELAEAPKVIDGALYIESSSLSQLWQTPVTWDGKAGTLFVATSNASFWDDFLINPFPSIMPGTGTTNPAEPASPPRATIPSAPQAPSTPFNGTAPSTPPASSVPPKETAPSPATPTAPTTPSNAGMPSAPSETPGNGAKIVAYAKNFMGTPYEFAAGPYSETRKFDCSSFVQFVYNHEGVELPRSSEAQANTGRKVDRNDLQPGDLVFFYTPGRFNSNKMVGHVAMYAGNGQIIHTYGDPGVTITDLNEPSWSKRYLYARREL
jgi:cell wall-associated NlpC family hydrolase